MAKVKRSVLKEIVKECLLEILFEGIDSESGYEEEEPIREARTQRRAPRPSPQRSLSAAVQETQRSRSKSPKKVLREAPVQAAVAELTQDPTMAAIFADTAHTTLQEQKEGRSTYIPADGAASKVQNTDDLGDLFEGAGNWAALAFGEVDK